MGLILLLVAFVTAWWFLGRHAEPEEGATADTTNTPLLLERKLWPSSMLLDVALVEESKLKVAQCKASGKVYMKSGFCNAACANPDCGVAQPLHDHLFFADDAKAAGIHVEQYIMQHGKQKSAERKKLATTLMSA